MRKLTRLFICGAAAVVLSTGCSGKTNEETKAPAETTAAESQNSEAADETADESQAAEAEVVDKGTVVLGEYKGIKLDAISTEVTAEDVDARINNILMANPDYVTITDRAAQDGDIVNIDYVGKKDGEAFDGGTASGYDLTLGSGQFIDGFEAGLVGAEAGEKRDLNLTFPEEYHSADLAGQAVVFEVTVNEIKEQKDAVLNDEFVQKVSDFKTVEEFKKDVEADLKIEKEEAAEMEQQNTVLMAALDSCEFKDIDAYVDSEFKTQYEQLSNMVAMSGMAISDYASMYGMDEEGFKDYLKSNVEDSVKIGLMTEEIAKQENLTIRDEDYQKVAEMNYAEDAQQLIDAYGQEAVDASAMNLRVIDFLIENAMITEK